MTRKDEGMDWPKDRRKSFLWAAEAFGTPYKERTEKQKDLTADGICFAVEELTDLYRSGCGKDVYSLFIDLGKAMGIKRSHWWPRRGDRAWTPSCDEERSLFCCLMAELSDEEFKAL